MDYQEKDFEERILDVPFQDKEIAKSLGAKWSSSLKKWFVPKTLPEEMSQVLFAKFASPDPNYIFCGEDRSFGGNGLFVDLVPESCWFTNVRFCVTNNSWDRIRKVVYNRAGNSCEICGNIKDSISHRWIEAHERWQYDDVLRIQKLVRLIALCSDCHTVTHFGLAKIRGIIYLTTYYC